MYKRIEAAQISFYDFNQDLGFQLSEENEWVQLAQNIPWDDIEVLYQERFPSKTGNVAKSARMVLGSLIIQKRKGLSDRALVKEITENPYLQFFIGLPRFQTEAPFRPQSLVNFRKRMDCDLVNQVNERILSRRSSNVEAEKSIDTDAVENAGTVFGNRARTAVLHGRTIWLWPRPRNPGQRESVLPSAACLGMCVVTSVIWKASWLRDMPCLPAASTCF